MLPALSQSVRQVINVGFPVIKKCPKWTQVQRLTADAAASAPAAASTPAAASGEAPVEAYSKATSIMHWLMAAGIITCFATVQGAMATKDVKKKGPLMMVHKSSGLLVAGLLVPRIAVAFLTRRPGPVIGSPLWEQWAAAGSHYAMYGFMASMSISGVTMGYYGGRGLPFFGYTIPGAAKADPETAKKAFKIHKTVGPYFEYFLPVHVAGAFMHYFKGQAIFSRINPFA